MAADPQGVIYLEADEDITSAIDKLSKVDSATIQVVSAKRSTLFQSVINLKLLQKAAKDAGKGLVLVTGDRVATNLAGRVGVPVASQVGEAAAIPKVGAAVAAADDEIDAGSIDDEEVAAATSEKEPPAASPEPEEPKAAAIKPPRNRRVPSISAMQKRLFWGMGAVLLIVLLVALNFYLTSATVTLYAKGSQGSANFDLTADPTATKSDPATGVVGAQQLTATKNLTALAQATGTQDNGSKASGTMTVNNCYDSSSHDLVAGTRFVAPDGNVFVTTSPTSVPGATTTISGGHIAVQPGKTTVGVQAVANGDSYNEAPAAYTVPGLPASQQSTSCSLSGGGIYGQGAQMGGGITKIDKIITQGDLDKAQQAALDSDKSAGTQSVSGKANHDQTVLAASLQQTVNNVSASPTVGSVANNATLTIPVTYTVLAVAKSDLSSVAQAKELQQLGNQNQIYDDGTSNLQLSPEAAVGSGGAQRFRATATVFYGPQINTAAVANQLKGQKYGDAVQAATQVSGVTRADIKLSPSWATGLPSIASHIHITIKVDNSSG